MGKKKEFSGVAVAEPVRSSAAEILRRREIVHREQLADRQYYAAMIQQLAAGEADDMDRTALEMVASEFGFSIEGDLDRLRKMQDWSANGFLPSDAEGYQQRLDELQREQAEAMVELQELRAKVQQAEVTLYNAGIAAGKFEARGLEFVRFRQAMPHVFAVEAAS